MPVAAALTATSDGVAWTSLTTDAYLATNVILAGTAIMAAKGHGLDRRVRGLAASRVHWSVEH